MRYDDGAMAEWILQSNPKLYDLDAAVEASRIDSWGTRLYRSEIRVGDTAWLQVVGQNDPGLYYVATITSVPYETPGHRFGPWHTDIRYDYRLKPPFLRAEAKADPILADFIALRGFQGTVRPVPPDIAARLREVTKGRHTPLGDAPPPDDADVGRAIELHNLRVRQELKAAIRHLGPEEFEHLVVSLLEALGYNVKHTGCSGDGGVDAVAVLSLGGLTSVTTRVQAKRWKSSVSSSTVRELRGALKIDERGLIVTTAEFTADAKKEAGAEGKARIGLLGGEELVKLCVDHCLGVLERRVSLIELDRDGLL